MKNYLLVLGLSFCVSTLAQSKASSEAARAALEKLQTSWKQTQSYQTDFTQTVKSKATALEEEPSEGTLSVIKPNHLRWEDKTTHITQLLNADSYWEITENPRRKTRSVVERKGVSKSVGKSSLAILLGRGKFEEFYKVRLLSDSKLEAVLQLIPKGDPSETLIAKVDKNGYVLRSLTTDSPDSRIEVLFKNTRRNVDLPESLFQYEKKPNDVFESKKE